MKAEIDLYRIRDCISRVFNEILEKGTGENTFVAYNWTQVLLPKNKVRTDCVTWKTNNDSFTCQMYPAFNGDLLESVKITIQSKQDSYFVITFDSGKDEPAIHIMNVNNKIPSISDNINRYDRIITEDYRTNEIIHATTEAWKLRFKK